MSARRSPTPPRTSRALLALGPVALLLLLALSAFPAHSQDLALIYREARFTAQAQRLIDEHGPRAALMPPETLPLPPHSVLKEWVFDDEPDSPDVPVLPPYEVENWQFVDRLQRTDFRRTFRTTQWAYLSSYGITPLDTTLTRELRARLEAQFGPPTQTLAEQSVRRTMASDSPVQFEYWFVLNDTVPLIVTDAGGPRDRGLIVATDAQHRDLLPSIRASFLGAIMKPGDLAPYVDYYYSREEKAWYRTGYDGQTYFQERVGRPNLIQGRPRMEGQ